MARPKKLPPPTLTTLLLVRHGNTSTTGKLLPGRAPGLHLAESGMRQAERAGERIAELKRVDAIYTSPLERARETAAPIAKATGLKPQVERGLLECDFGDWTGAELKKLMKLPEWRTVQTRALDVPLPERRELHRDAGADRHDPRSAARQAPRRHRRLRQPRRPDQGGDGACARHPPRPVPADRHLDLLDQRDRLRR